MQILDEVWEFDSDISDRIVDVHIKNTKKTIALFHNLNIIIADKPTGNLDADTAESIINIFSQLAHTDRKCVIIVTHSK